MIVASCLTKHCKGCGEVKELNEDNFHRDKRTQIGFRSKCKVCVARYDKIQGDRYRKSRSGWAVCLVKEARRRAKLKGLNINITPEWVIINMPRICPVLGIPLFRGIGKSCDNSPTLDRIDNSKGYTVDNVEIISMKANRAKSDLNLEEIERLYFYFHNLKAEVACG